MKLQVFAFAGLLTVVVPQNAIAFGGGGRDNGGWPPELEMRAVLMEESFARYSEQDLARQRWAGTLCENHPCFNKIGEQDVTEDQAKDLLDSYMNRKEEWFAASIAWAGVVISALSLVVSIFAFRQSNNNEREIGALQSTASSSQGPQA